MKIQGTNLARIQAYKNNLQEQKKQSKPEEASDELKISNEAKQLQQSKSLPDHRTEYVKQIKQTVDSGQYKVNHQDTAQKMLDFWSQRS